MQFHLNNINKFENFYSDNDYNQFVFKKYINKLEEQ